MSDQSDIPISTKQTQDKSTPSEVKASVDRTVLSKLSIEVVVEDGDWKALQPTGPMVDETALAITRHFGNPANKDHIGHAHQVTLALTSDAHVAKLNETYRGKPAPTNVLSFPNPMATSMGTNITPGSPIYLGDIVMAQQTILNEASDLNIPLKSHFQHLLVHGVLHLAGYDHETDDEARQMEDLEIIILKTMGISDPYQDRA